MGDFNFNIGFSVGKCLLKVVRNVGLENLIKEFIRIMEYFNIIIDLIFILNKFKVKLVGCYDLGIFDYYFIFVVVNLWR